MRSFEEVQRAAKERAAKEFAADVAKRNQGIKKVVRTVKEPVQEVKEVRVVSGTFTAQERKDSEQTMFEFRVWVQSQVVDASRQAAATTA